MKAVLLTLLPLLLSVLFSVSFGSQQASAEFEGCLDLFPDRTPPIVSGGPHLMARSLCFDAFAVLYSGLSKTPIYAVERLSPEQLWDAQDEV